MLNAIKANFSTLIKENNEILEIPTKQGKKLYVKYEGWVTIATIMGILPQITEIQPFGKGFMAKAVAVNVKTGQVLGSAFGICSKDEPLWANRPEFSVAAMAQTRAASRALKSILGGVITHLGYESAPAEIADEEEDQQPARAENPNPASEKQLKCIWAVAKSKGLGDEEIKAIVKAEYKKESTKDLTVSEASNLIERLQR